MWCSPTFRCGGAGRPWAGFCYGHGLAAGRAKHGPTLGLGCRQDRAGPRKPESSWPNGDNGDMAKVVPGCAPQTVLVAISFGLWQALGLGLCIADSFGQHLAKLSLRLRGFPLEGFLPLGHEEYVGMLESKLNPRWSCPRAQVAERSLPRSINPKLTRDSELIPNE